jgi:hypothetical protein
MSEPRKRIAPGIIPHDDDRNIKYAFTPEFTRAVVFYACSSPRFYRRVGAQVHTECLPHYGLEPAEAEAHRFALSAAHTWNKAHGAPPSRAGLVVQMLRTWMHEGKVTEEQLAEVSKFFDGFENNPKALPEEDTARALVPILQDRMRLTAIRLIGEGALKHDPNAFDRALDVAATIKQFGELGAAVDSSPFSFAMATEIAAPQAPPPFLSRRLGLVRGRPSVFISRSKIGKTIFAQSLELSIASGASLAWGGVPIALSGKVRHLSYEMPRTLLATRYQRLAHGLSVDLAALGDKLGSVSYPSAYLNTKGVEDALLRALDGVAFATIDNLRAAAPGEEENGSEFRQWLDLLARVTEHTGCFIFVLAHEGKDNARGARGNSAIEDAAGAVVSMTKTSNSDLCVRIARTSEGAEQPPAYFRIVDTGDYSETTGMHEGLAVEMIEPPTDDEGDLAEVKERVKKIISAHKPANPSAVAKLAKGVRRQTVLTVLRELREDREVEERGGVLTLTEDGGTP